MKKIYLLMCMVFFASLSNLSAQTITTVDVSAIGVCDGSATIDTTSSNNPADSSNTSTWVWTDANNNNVLQTGGTTIHNLCSGNYSVTFTNANGYSYTHSFAIGNPCSNFGVSLSPTYLSSSGACDGAVNASTHNGYAPFTYLWSDSSSNSSISNLCGGNYSVTITDSLGCTASASTHILFACANFSVNTVQMHAASPNACDGEAAFSITGNINNNNSYSYTCLWSNSSTDSTARNLCPGTYSVRVTDSNGCTDSATITITVNVCNNLNVYATSTIASGANVCDGTATASASGGTQPYTFVWSDSTAAATANYLCGSTNYTVTVTDSNGCTSSSSVYIHSQTSALSVSGIITDSDSSNCTGSANITVFGGSPPYNFSLNGSTMYNVSTTHLYSNLCPGVYTFVVSDSTSTDSYTFVVGSPANVYVNTPYQGSTVVDTVSAPAMESCAFTYANVDSIVISSYTQVADTVIVHWTVYAGNYDTTYVVAYTVSANGVTTFVLSLYCTSQHRTAPAIAKASDQLNLTGLLGVATISKGNISVYPNPFGNEINISNAKNASVTITDMLGRVLLNKSRMDGGSINTESLNAGIYFISISSEGNVNTYKVIKN